MFWSEAAAHARKDADEPQKRQSNHSVVLLRAVGIIAAKNSRSKDPVPWTMRLGASDSSLMKLCIRWAGQR